MTNAKLHEEDVRTIRREHAAGLASARELALRYGMAAESIRKILRWETFAWVGEGEPVARPPAREASPEEIAASQARFLEKATAAGLASPEPTGQGLERLQAEAHRLGRGDALLGELEKKGD